MKLFGNSGKGQHVKSRAEQKAEQKAAQTGTAEETAKPQKKGLRARWKAIPLVLKIVLIFLAVILAAVIAVAIWWVMNVKPPETTSATTADSTVSTAEKQTTTTIKIDEETGETVEVEVYSDGEEAFEAPTTKTVTEIDEETGEEYEYEIPVSKREGFYNILIAGTDDDGTRTDTIMIASLDTETHEVAIMSVPRDTYISANYSVPKINSAYGAGGTGESGMAALKNQLAKLLGFEVDGYVLVDLDAFVEIVDLVGGVEFDVPMDMYYVDPEQDLYINLSAGLQVLDGEHAMQLVRYRSGYAAADITRTEVQQDFMRALAKQCLQFDNVDKITELADIISEYVLTDLTVGNMVYFATELLQCDFDEMVTVTLPGESITVNGGSYYALYKNQVLEIINEYFNPYDTEITASDVTILTSSSSSGGSSSTYTYRTGSSGSTASSGSSSGSAGSSADTVSDYSDEQADAVEDSEDSLPGDALPTEDSDETQAGEEGSESDADVLPGGSSSGSSSSGSSSSDTSGSSDTGSSEAASDSSTGSADSADTGSVSDSTASGSSGSSDGMITDSGSSSDVSGSADSSASDSAALPSE